MRRTVFYLFLMLAVITVQAQDGVIKPRPLSMEEYEKAKQFTIKDLDNDTYVKIENAYILDRYEMRKPYFITGDDGLKKRIDLYKLIAKDSLQELGVMIFYTNETGKRYNVCLPNFTATGKVWEKYFEDIHAIDKEEKNFVLKLSYILSKEVGFQLYKSLNQDKDLKEESATYGNDICFPGNQQVLMANGASKLLQDIAAGDRIISIDPVNHTPQLVTVNKLVQHEAKNYAITRLTLMAATETVLAAGIEVQLTVKLLEATPNHPVQTVSGKKKAEEITINDAILCLHERTGAYIPYRVVNSNTVAGGIRKVYNIEASAGTTLMINEVMVLQK